MCDFGYFLMGYYVGVSVWVFALLIAVSFMRTTKHKDYEGINADHIIVGKRVSYCLGTVIEEEDKDG